MASLKAHVFFNESHPFEHYRAGDVLKASHLGPQSYEDFGRNDEGDNEWLRACEHMFRILNADDRPNGKYERSLSVGDVVVLEQGDEVRAFWCDSFGWTFFEPEWTDDKCPFCDHDHRMRGGDRYVGDVLTAVPGHDDICDCVVPQHDAD